jgi:hypothetical protein
MSEVEVGRCEDENAGQHPFIRLTPTNNNETRRKRTEFSARARLGMRLDSTPGEQGLKDPEKGNDLLSG